MTRHGKNCTASAVYSYHEKKRDTKASGYGSQAERFSKDAVKGFDCCGLTLQPCREPVITSEGHLYDKEAILEYIVHQKQDYAKKLQAYEKEKRKLEEEEKDKLMSDGKNKVEKFLKSENSIATKKSMVFTATAKVSNEPNAAASSSASSSATSQNDKIGEKSKNLPSFWIPSLTPQAQKEKLKKPDSKVYCPLSGKPLKLKDLFPVKFTPVPSDDKRSVISKTARYMCPVTHDLLGNSVPCAVLKPTGDVVTMDCVENIIKKDWICPLTSKILKESDIITMNRGGTGYSAAGVDLTAKAYRPSMQTS